MKYLVLIGRILFSAIFLMSAPGHFTQGTIDYAIAHGVPLATIAVPFSGLIALAGALSVLVGYRAKFGAWLLVLFLLPVTFMMHNFWAIADATAAGVQRIMFMKNLSMLGGALLIAYFGAGPLSIDEKLR